MYIDGMYLDGMGHPVQLDVRMSPSRRSGWDGFGVFVGRPDILIQIRVFWCARGGFGGRVPCVDSHKITRPYLYIVSRCIKAMLSTRLSSLTCLQSPLTHGSARA